MRCSTRASKPPVTTSTHPLPISQMSLMATGRNRAATRPPPGYTNPLPHENHLTADSCYSRKP